MVDILMTSARVKSRKLHQRLVIAYNKSGRAVSWLRDSKHDENNEYDKYKKKLLLENVGNVLKQIRKTYDKEFGTGLI
jgi:hypothetical protein